MGGNYEKSVYNQLMDVMARLDVMEAEHKNDRKEIADLNAEVKSLRKENFQKGYHSSPICAIIFFIKKSASDVFSRLTSDADIVFFYGNFRLTVTIENSMNYCIIFPYSQQY